MGETAYIIGGGLAILLIGLGLGFWAARLRSVKHAAKAADVQQQFDDYRESVTAHFGRTAEHFQTISQEYRELYEHMASGADALIDQQAIDEKLSFVPSAVIEASSDDTESDEVETPVAEPADDQDVGSTDQSNEDADDSQRTYH